MCGIVGLFAKSEAVERQLGALLGEMLGQLADRGPDSAGIALYREPAAPGHTKLSLFSADPDEDWAALFGSAAVHASHAVVELEGRKLRGRYALTRTDTEPRERWLLVKVRDEEADARRDPVSTQPESVLTGRTIEQVAAGEPAN